MALIGSRALAAAVLITTAPTTALPAPISYFQMSKATIIGHRIELGKITDVGLDCKLLNLPNISIVNQPLHGKISIVREAIFPYFASPNPRASCNSHKVDAVVIYYSPAARYAGTDSVRYRIAFREGNIREGKVDIDIR